MTPPFPKGGSPIVCGEDCPFHRVGLPIFPVRYSVLLNNSYSPPALTDDLLTPVLKAENKTLGDAARYGVRLLRPGYLYLYDEARDVLEAYFVNENNTLYKFNPDQPLNSGASAFTCTMDHQATASLLTIPNATAATNVWLTFSDVQWTKAVCDRHCGAKGAEERRKHMVEFNVQQWLGPKKHAGARRILNMQSVVAEYFVESRRDMDMYAKMQQFDWSTTTYMSRQSWMSSMIQDASHRFSPGNGVMLALPDTTGIAQDLARLMRFRFDEFTKNPADLRPLTLSKTIESLKEIVADKAESELLAKADREAANMEVYGTTMPMAGGEPGMSSGLGEVLVGQMAGVREQRKADADRIRNPDESVRAKVRESSWSDYVKDYSEPDRLTFQNDFNRRLSAFDTNTIVPLAKAHVAWMTCPETVGGFECNYDPADIDSGDVYLTIFTLCIDGVQDKKVCFDLLLSWLLSDPTKSKNLILRAMFHNQDLVIKKVQDATATTVDWKGIPWNNLSTEYGVATKRLGKNAVEKTAQLIEQALGPITRVMNAGMDSNVARRMAVMLGVVSRTQVQIVEVTGSKKAFRAALIREVLRQHGGEVSQRKMEQAVADEMRRLDVAGETLEGTDKKKWFRLVDSEAAASVPKTGSEKDRAAALAQTTMTIEQYEAKDLARWRAVISTDVRVGTVSCVFQGVALYKLWSDLQSAMPHERGDATWKFVVGIASTGGSIAEVLGNVLVGRGELGMRFGAGVDLAASGKLLARFGSKIGIVTGAIMAFFDLKSGVHELTVERNGLMGGLYMASAGLSVVVLIAFAFEATVVGLILSVVLIVISILISIFQDNKVQAWLKRCMWGASKDKPSDNPYQSLQDEMNALNVALGGN